MRWRNLRRAGQSLQAQTSPGRPSTMSPEEWSRLSECLRGGPRASGIKKDYWTARLVVGVLEKHAGVRFHRTHVLRLMHQLGWVYRRPPLRVAEAKTARDWERLSRWERWVRRDGGTNGPGSLTKAKRGERANN